MKPKTVCKKSLAVILAGLMMMGNIGSAGAESSSNSDPSNQQVETAYKSPVRVSLFKYKTKPDKTAQPSALREEATEKEESTQKVENETEKKESVTEKKADNNNTSDQSLNENKSAQEEGTDTEQPAPKSSDIEQPTRGEADNGSVNEETNGTRTEYQTINEYNYYTRGDKKALQFIGGGATVLDETGFNKCINGTAYQGIFADNLVNGALVESPGVHTLPLFSTTNYNSDKTYYYTDEDPYVTGYYNIDTTKLYIKSNDGEYSYDSDKNEAIFDPETGEIAAGGTPTEAGSFFPFENKTGEKFHFGVMTDFNFVVPESEKNNTSDDKYIFEFSADDDLCAYIDGTKVVDVGGIHDAVTAKLNVITGVVEYYNKDGGTAAIIKVNENSNQNVQQEQSSTTGYADGNAHRMQVFYLERGAGKGTLRMKFKPADDTNNDDIKATKTASLVSEADRRYKIDINVAAKPKQHVVTKPSNVVMVLDASSSMRQHDAKVVSGGGKAVYDALDKLDKERTYYASEKNTTVFYSDKHWRKRYKIKGNEYKTVIITSASDCPSELYQRRVDTMVDAIKSLVDVINKDSMLAIVVFNSKANTVQEFVKVGGAESTIKQTIEEIPDMIEYGSLASKGLDRAHVLFANGRLFKEDEENDVIYFSDGELSTREQTSAISYAQRLKNDNVTIWGVVYAGDTSGSTYRIASDNKVVSSEGIEGLAEAFYTIVTSLEIQKGKVIDYLDDRFDLVDGEGNPINGDKIDSNGHIGTVVRSISGTYIVWENETFGDLEDEEKWNVHFYIQAKDSYLGGYCVPTNGSASSVIVGDVIKPLNMPTVDVPLKKCSFRNYEETFYLGTNLKNVWKNVRDIAKPGQNEELNMMVDNDVMDALMNSINNDTLTATLDRDYAYTSSGDKDGSIRYTLKLEGTNTCEDHRVTEVGKAREVYTLTAVYTPRTRQDRENSLLGIYKERLNANVDIGDDGKTIEKTGSYTVNVVAGSLKISKVISKEDYEKSLESGDATFTFRVTYTPLKDQSKETIDDKSIDLYKTVRFTDKESYSLKETEDKKGYIISTTMNDLARGKYVVSELETMGYRCDSVVKSGYSGAEILDGKKVEFIYNQNNSNEGTVISLKGSSYETISDNLKVNVKYTNSNNHSGKLTDTDVVKNTFDMSGSTSNTKIADNDYEANYRDAFIHAIERANVAS